MLWKILSVSNFSPLSVKLSDLKPCLCFLQVVCCGDRLEFGQLQKLTRCSRASKDYFLKGLLKCLQWFKGYFANRQTLNKSIIIKHQCPPSTFGWDNLEIYSFYEILQGLLNTKSYKDLKRKISFPVNVQGERSLLNDFFWRRLISKQLIGICTCPALCT